MSPEELLDRLTDGYEAILNENFVGMYVHGSYAMGCFNPVKSDLDYILVCESEPDDETRLAVLRATVALTPYAPKKGLEMHLMLREDCHVYRHPPRFLLHYSPAHDAAVRADAAAYVRRMRGNDLDLAAHLTVMKRRGLLWRGMPLAEVFGDVPREAYLESVLDDAGWSEGDAMYHVLNRCRILAYVREGRVLSKKEGAQWALEQLEEALRPAVREALTCYESDEEMKNIEAARTFCAATLSRIRAELSESLTLES